jgi:hypothetical protein
MGTWKNLASNLVAITPSSSNAARQASKKVAENVPRASLRAIPTSVSSKPCFVSRSAKFLVAYPSPLQFGLDEAPNSIGVFLLFSWHRHFRRGGGAAGAYLTRHGRPKAASSAAFRQGRKIGVRSMAIGRGSTRRTGVSVRSAATILGEGKLEWRLPPVSALLARKSPLGDNRSSSGVRRKLARSHPGVPSGADKSKRVSK